METDTNANDTDKQRSTDRDGLYKRGSYWHYELTVEGKRRSFTTRTKIYTEAKKVRAQALHDLKDGRLPVDGAKLILRKASEAWTASRTGVVSPGTQRIDKERLVPLLRSLGEFKLMDLTATTIRRYQEERAATVSPRTVNLEIKVLRGILQRSKLWLRICEDVRPLKEDRKGPGRALTFEDERRLLETAGESPDWLVAFNAAVIAIHTGMRGVELRHLRLRDIDLDARIVTVWRSKTEAGVRTIPLTNEAVKAFLRLIERAQILGAALPEHFLLPFCVYQSNYRTPGSRALQTPEMLYDPGRPMATWRNAWRKLTRAAGLPGFRFHDLRHCFITTMAEWDVPEATMKALAGHMDSAMLEHYSHVRQQAKRDAIDAVEKARAGHAKVLGISRTTETVQ